MDVSNGIDSILDYLCLTDFRGTYSHVRRIVHKELNKIRVAEQLGVFCASI